MSTIMNHAVEKEYLALVRAFPLLSIRDEEHLSEALAVIDRLTDTPHRSAAEDAYLNALTDLVETYENAHVEIPPVNAADALRYLMEENGLTAEDLAASPDTAARILQRWLLGLDRDAKHANPNNPQFDVSLFTAQLDTQTNRAVWGRYLATLLGVPPDALDAFVETISKETMSRESKPTNSA